jgi:hypothetical protein
MSVEGKRQGELSISRTISKGSRFTLGHRLQRVFSTAWASLVPAMTLGVYKFPETTKTYAKEV